MNTKLAVKIDSRLLSDIKILAAESGVSISDFVTLKLKEVIRERKEKDYDRSPKRAVARLKRGFDLGWKPPDSRDDLHER